jgi:RimJ/RimL family protein N-acetyltransferase
VFPNGRRFIYSPFSGVLDFRYNSSMDIIIRKLQPHESAIYRAVRLACLKNVPEFFGSTYEEEVLNPKFLFETYIETGSSDHVMFGAFDDERLIGITGFNRMARKRASHRGELVQVYVESAYRGQNIGEKLLRHVLDYDFSLEGIEQVQLSVITRNIRAIELYEKLGFKTFGVQPRYFKVKNGYLDQQFMQLFRSDY